MWTVNILCKIWGTSYLTPPKAVVNMALQQKSHLCIYRNGIARPQSQFPHSCAIYIFPGSVHIFSCSIIGRSIVGIYKSLTDTWMWKLKLWPRNSFSGNNCFEFSVLCLCMGNAQLQTHSVTYSHVI